MDWKFYSARRRVSLKDFLAGCDNEQEALQRFNEKQLTDPPMDEIKRMFTKPAAKPVSVTVTPVTPVPQPAPVAPVSAPPAVAASEPQPVTAKSPAKKAPKNATETPGS